MFLLDVENQIVDQKLDWNTVNIDWSGRGADRGLRGIAFHGESIFIAASDELFAYSPEFELLGHWRSAYLKHCHEIAIYRDVLYLTSTGFDSILGFNLAEQKFDRGFHLQTRNFKFSASLFDPNSDTGPLALNKLHVNSVYCDENGLYVSGLKTGGMLHFNGEVVNMAVELPPGTHNARPFRDGVLFNDTRSNVLRYTGRGESDHDRAMPVPAYRPRDLTHTNLDSSRIARQGFARGLCVLSESVVAGGSSPSTVTLWDVHNNRQLLSVALTMDIRNSIHGLEVWPFS